jgi:hypothetical protein
MDEATFQEAIAGTVPHYDVNVRQVSNGFALAGNIRYVIEATQTVKVAQSFEAVATDTADACAAAANFLNTGKF